MSTITRGHTGINLLIVDVLENLLVPGISNSTVFTWNMRLENYFELLFAFAQSNLHDNVVIIFIHSSEPKVLLNLHEWAFIFGFEEICDWWGINNLLLASSSALDEFKVSIQSSSLLYNFARCYFFIPHLTYLLCRACGFLLRFLLAKAPGS